ncbi:hypothetical protein JZ751_010398 [Albula glossodonta]|uniref:non-specific serine/threonine protein kinase n=1 Tax=Albula glossodonta TaxID=121402 RepID=A0A8T2NZZ8_9TELE|nr:hypothetical protein JZ751_010398 [Albula glossodonta]
MSTRTPLPTVNERDTENHTSHSDGRSEVTARQGRSGARCRNSIASCTDEQPHIGNYRLLKTIGKGNFAKVKLARHILTSREVAIKIIDKTQLNPTSLQKCCQETGQSGDMAGQLWQRGTAAGAGHCWSYKGDRERGQCHGGMGWDGTGQEGGLGVSVWKEWGRRHGLFQAGSQNRPVKGSTKQLVISRIDLSVKPMLAMTAQSEGSHT